jgi:hypothetical protein
VRVWGGGSTAQQRLSTAQESPPTRSSGIDANLRWKSAEYASACAHVMLLMSASMVSRLSVVSEGARARASGDAASSVICLCEGTERAAQ